MTDMGPGERTSERDTRVLLADDQATFREVACGVVAETRGLELVAAVACLSRLPELIDRHGADVLLLDVRIPGEDTLGMAALLRRTRPDVQVVLVSVNSIEDIPQEIFELGVGFLAKEDLSPQTLVETIAALSA